MSDLFCFMIYKKLLELWVQEVLYLYGGDGGT